MSVTDPEYQQSLVDTEIFTTDGSAGFVNLKTREKNISKQWDIQVKQTNVLIDLLVKLHNKVDKLEERLSRLEKGKEAKEQEDLKQAIEELSQKVAGVQIGDKEKQPPVVINRVYFRKDPKEILEKERQKSK